MAFDAEAKAGVLRPQDTLDEEPVDVAPDTAPKRGVAVVGDTKEEVAVEAEAKAGVLVTAKGASFINFNPCSTRRFLVPLLVVETPLVEMSLPRGDV